MKLDTETSHIWWLSYVSSFQGKGLPRKIITGVKNKGFQCVASNRQFTLYAFLIAQCLKE